MNNVIAEIVSLSGYESQVSALLNEDERLAMEFYIACAPEDHPVIAGAGGFRKARWARRGKGKSGGFRVVYFFLAEPGRIYMAAIYAKSRRRPFRRPISTCSQDSRLRSRKQQRGDNNHGRAQFECRDQEADQVRPGAGAERQRNSGIVLPDEVDVKRIRTNARMSQAEFARAFCINPRTLQEWEQGRRKPDATTRAYLAVIAKNREAVLDALAP